MSVSTRHGTGVLRRAWKGRGNQWPNGVSGRARLITGARGPHVDTRADHAHEERQDGNRGRGLLRRRRGRPQLTWPG